MDNIFIRLGKLFFRYRNGLFPVVYLAIFLFSKPGLFMGDKQLDRYACIIGIIIILAGQLFRVMVIGFAYIKRGGKDGKVYAPSLVVSGFYAHVRNPMYVGNYLILLGFVILYGSVWAYLFILPFFTLVYYSIVVNEENYLREKFGTEYDDYAKYVNRFIPDLSGLKQSLDEYEYNWKKALRKEYGTIFLVVIGILAMMIWKDMAVYGFDTGNIEIRTLIFLMIPAVIFYGVTRYLKLTGRLQTS